MRKYSGIFAFFALLFSFMFFRVVDDEGAGGGSDGDEFDDDLDTDLDDGAGDDGGKDDPQDKGEPPEKGMSEEDKNLLEDIKQERALNQIAKELKKEYGDSFDMDKIVNHLKDMEAKEKGSGQALFNKQGIENTYLKNFHTQVLDGGEGFEGKGRGTKTPTTDELVEKINKNEASDSERTALFAKFA